MEHPTASIVIIAWNEEATIGACLESACQQDYPNIVEIIVVDGNRPRQVTGMSIGAH